jgi:prolyl-tRNA editing enzyme YbaK/EbsC (Cys-tRNA(Pro) deacylase)
MPVGATVNVRLGDYDQSAGTLKVSLKKGSAPTSIKLARTVQVALKRYIASLGMQVSASDPMFGAVSSGQGNVDTKKAACSAELKTVLMQRAKAAGLSPKKIFVK